MALFYSADPECEFAVPQFFCLMLLHRSSYSRVDFPPDERTVSC